MVNEEHYFLDTLLVAKPDDSMDRIIAESQRRIRLAEHKWQFSIEELRRRGYTSDEIDAVEAREPYEDQAARAWSVLANKFVGARY